MEWSGQEAYNKAPWVNFTVDGELAGNFTGTDQLGFLKVGTESLLSAKQTRRITHNGADIAVAFGQIPHESGGYL